MLVHAFHEGMIVDFAETLGEGDLLLGRDVLVAEKDHEMLEPGRLYFRERLIVQATQVDAGDLGAERSCDGLDFDPPIGCHGLAPFVGGYFSAARAASGQVTAAPPSSVMNSRRFR